MKRTSWAAALSVSAVVLAGCGSQSPLAPHSPQARDISTLWWWMLGVAGVIFLGAVGMLAVGWWRRDKPGLPLVGSNERATTGLVVVFGIVIPALILIALFAVSDLYVIKDTEAPAAGTTRLTIDVTGHQWFWEVGYPGTAAVTANEIHIPVRTRVLIVARTADVIHSFWVPELNRKIDMIPGQANQTLLYADRVGVYRGQCAEFCGLQHAHMSMKVFADPPQRFKRWLAHMAAPASPPGSGEQRSGQQVFLADACASCHTIRGTPADGTIGPDLTHLATRTSLAADTIPNQRSELSEWIRDPQHVKPGNKMPAIGLSPGQRQAVVAYLMGMK